MAARFYEMDKRIENMIRDPKFDDIRPYYEEEIPEAMHRIASSSSFPLLASYVYPDEPIDVVRNRIAGYTNVHDFQTETMVMVNQRVIDQSITEFSCSGIERLRPDENYLYVSNHRDIMLDSSLLQYFFVKQGFDTTEITFGANLMMNQLVVDIGKCNKMFKVERPGGSIKEFYRSSMHLSEYIRYAITEKHQSVWIAQRNGRTKDGVDATDQGIIKMFCMSEPRDKIKALADLHIVPVAISYEWESCDILKALELYESRFSKYIKKPGEDLNSILTGIAQPKGRVNITFCDELSEADLHQFDHCTNNEYHRLVAQLIDQRIYEAYQLTPNNYIAHDLRYGQQLYRDHYTDAEYDAFVTYLERLNTFDIPEPDVLRDIYLGIYANPVDTKMGLHKD